MYGKESPNATNEVTTTITIPKLNINGEGILDLQTKDTTLDVTAQFEGSSETLYATLKLQGTSSLSYEKKNYTINFYKDSTYSEKNKIDLGYGWGAQNKYCLKANWIDSTQARNIVSARLAAQMASKYGLFEDSPNNGLIDGNFVEIYINGTYRGLYTLNIPKDDWMFNMNKNNENHIVMCAENPNRGSATTFEQLSSTVDGEDWSIEVGPNETPAEVEATFEKLNRVIGFVKDSTNAEFREHFSEYLDLDATMNYYCFMALSNAVDNMSKNMLLVTYDGEVWYPSLYDLDTTWGLYFNGEGIYSVTNKVTDYGGGSSLLFQKLLECFPNEVQARYKELRETVLSNENIISEFEQFINSVPDEAWEREQTKWTNIPSKDYGINQIRTHVLERGNYIDSVMEQLVIEQKTYDDSRIIYQLDEQYVGGPYKYLDTGINLYGDETNLDSQNWTILARFKSANTHESEVIFAQRDQNRNGLITGTSGNADYGDDGYTTFYAGNNQYECLFGDNGEFVTIAIKKEGTNYYFYRENTSNIRIRPNSTENSENFTVDTPIASNLVLGASYYYVNGNVITENYYNGTISNFTVYNTALTETEISEKLTELNNIRAPLTDVTYTGDVKTTYAPGQNFSIGNAVFTAEYEDGTTRDITNELVFEPKKITKDTTEVKVSYVENMIKKEFTFPITLKEYSDSRIVYELEEEFVGNGNSYINTGVSLYDNGDAQDFTVIVRYKIESTGANLSVFSDTRDATYKGANIFSNDGTWTGVYAGNAGYEATGGDSRNKYSVVILKKEGTNYYLYQDSMTNTRTLLNKPVESAFPEEAIIGAARNSATTVTDYFIGKISNCVIYTEALSLEEMTNLMEEYTSYSNSKLSKIEITEIPNKTEYVSGEEIDLTGLKVIATYEDGTTEDVTTSVVIETSSISTTTSEIKLSYTENQVKKEASYSITVELSDNYVKNAIVYNRTTGTAPFDTNNNAGNDASATNRVVRSFDEVEYSIRLELLTNNAKNANDGNIHIQAELPENCANDVTWDIEKTTWISSTDATLSEDGRTLNAIYKIEDKNKLQGTQNITFIIDVLGAQNGMEFKPSFKFWLTGNQIDPTSPDYNVCEFTPDENLIVSSKPSYNIALTQNTTLNTRTTVSLNGQEESGRMFGYSLILQLYNESQSKGLKGIEVPKGNITFDVDMTMSKKLNGTETDITDTSTPVLWNYKINTTTDTGKILNREMKINGLENTNFGYVSAPYGVYNEAIPNECVYNSGDINIVQDDNKLSVTISDYVIKNLFPEEPYYSSNTPYTKNIGCFSVGYVELFVKDNDELTDENAEYYITVEDKNMQITSKSNQTISTQIKTNDDKINARYYYSKPGEYSNWLVFYKKGLNESLTPNTHIQAGYSLRDNEFDINWFVKLLETNDDATNISTFDGLLKFDADAMIPTGTFRVTSNNNSNNNSNSSDMEFKIYYATKKDGTNWQSQSEMNNSTFSDLNYYENYEDIPSDEKCVALYIESTNGMLKQGDNNLIFGFKTTKTSIIGQTYAITKDVYMYIDELDRTVYTRTSEVENYPEATYRHANENFIPATYNSEGEVTEGSGLYLGQTLLIIGANQSAPISVKEDANGNVKKSYDIGKNENIAKFKITPTIASTKIEEIEPTTLTISSLIPEGLEYVEGSNSYDNVDVETVTDSSGNTFTKLTWKIYGVNVNQALDEITFETRISNQTLNNKKYTVTSYIIADNDAIGNIIKREREYSTTISIINLDAHTFYKETDSSVVERNSQIHYTLTYKNNTGETVNNFRILDILPYSGDDRGSSFSGSFIVDKITVTTNTEETINVYVSNDTTTRNIDSISDEDLTNNKWNALEHNTNGIYNLNSAQVAIMIEGIMTINSNILVDIYITPTGNESGDKYINMAETSIENLTSSSATSVVVFRKISGVVWLDKNENGIIDSGEDRLENIKLSLIPVGSNERAIDVYGNEVLDTYTDSKGCYVFDKLSKNDYIVMITLDDNYQLTEKKVGTNDSINSKFNVESKKTDTITRLNHINDAVLNEENVNAGIIYSKEKISKQVIINWKDNNNETAARPNKVTLKITGNGEEYTQVITNEEAESDNAWTHTIDYLPKYDNNGQEIQYTIEQEAPTGYFKSISPEENGVFNITNYKLGQVKIIAEDMDKNKLAGAKFVLTDSNNETVDVLVTDDTGIIIFPTLEYGNYTLTELSAPKGYNLQKVKVDITLSEDNMNYTATIKHRLKTILPNTGKTQTLYMIILYIVLLRGGAKVLITQKKKNKIRRNTRKKKMRKR